MAVDEGDFLIESCRCDILRKLGALCLPSSLVREPGRREQAASDPGNRDECGGFVLICD